MLGFARPIKMALFGKLKSMYVSSLMKAFSFERKFDVSFFVKDVQ